MELLLVLCIMVFAAAVLGKVAEARNPLKPCRHCRGEVSKLANWCPRCGGPNP